MSGKKLIFIVDDDVAICDALTLLFEDAGYQTEIFIDGNSILRQSLALPDLYLVDRQLPDVDGIDVCKFLKEQERSRKIPVLILSATPNVRNLAATAGADAFLEKPFSMQDLLSLVRRLLDAESQL